MILLISLVIYSHPQFSSIARVFINEFLFVFNRLIISGKAGSLAVELDTLLFWVSNLLIILSTPLPDKMCIRDSQQRIQL